MVLVFAQDRDEFFGLPKQRIAPAFHTSLLRRTVGWESAMSNFRATLFETETASPSALRQASVVDAECPWSSSSASSTYRPRRENGG